MALGVWLDLVRSRLPGAYLGHVFVVKSVQVGIRVAGVELNLHFLCPGHFGHTVRSSIYLKKQEVLPLSVLGKVRPKPQSTMIVATIRFRAKTEREQTR